MGRDLQNFKTIFATVAKWNKCKEAVLPKCKTYSETTSKHDKKQRSTTTAHIAQIDWRKISRNLLMSQTEIRGKNIQSSE